VRRMTGVNRPIASAQALRETGQMSRRARSLALVLLTLGTPTANTPDDQAPGPPPPRAHARAAMDAGSIPPSGPLAQLPVVGFEPNGPLDASRQVRALEAAAPALRAMGITGHQWRVRWGMCEPVAGRYDWSICDRYVDAYRRTGIKWAPVLVLGSADAVPAWFRARRDAGYQGFVCLEHGREHVAPSLWSPALKRHIARFVEAFCRRYRDAGVIESLSLAITGERGEAAYPSGSRVARDARDRLLHTHEGLWAGDPCAVESFRAWLARKYGGSSPLRDAWGPRASNLNTVRPFLKRDAPNERAWLDLCDWYIGSLTEWCGFWMAEARKHFPVGDLYLCTRPEGSPEWGVDLGGQCRAAKAAGGGILISCDDSGLPGGLPCAGWETTRPDERGAYLGFQHPGNAGAREIAHLLYRATTARARSVRVQVRTVLATQASRELLPRWAAGSAQPSASSEIAVYYPETHVRLYGNDFQTFVAPLRDRFDFRVPGMGNAVAFRAAATRRLAEAPELSAETRTMLTADGREDGVFVALRPRRTLLWLNATDRAVHRGGSVIAPHSIAETPLPLPAAPSQMRP